MRFPQYWSQATAEEPDRDGQPSWFTCWRWSDISQQDAYNSALTAARRVLRSYLDGKPRDRYAYGRSPLREEVLQRFTGDQGELVAAITQNAYGSLVLNTAQVMFIDLDFDPVPAGQHVKHFFSRLVGRPGSSPVEQQESATRRRLEEFLAKNSDWSVRVYRTRAGLRVLATHELFDPAAESTEELLSRAGSDPLYIRLCRAQQCFRARLTPKPWRCGHHANEIRWPREGGAQVHFDAWQAKYLDRQAKFATCRFLESIGGGRVHPQAQLVIDVHDRATRCDEALQLA